MSKFTAIKNAAKTVKDSVGNFGATVAHHPKTWGGRAWNVERDAVSSLSTGRKVWHAAQGVVFGVPNLAVGAVSTLPRAGAALWKTGTTGKVIVGTGAAAAAAGTAYGVMGSSSKGMGIPPEMIETQAVLDENQQVIDALTAQQSMAAPMQQNPYNQAQPVVGGQMAYDGPVLQPEQGLAQG